MTKPIMVCVAPNGARKTKQDHPRLPLSAHELAVEAENCMNAGASMIHLHVRDENGKHSIEPIYYRPVIAAIRERVGDGLIIQATTEAVGQYTTEQQMAMVHDLKPEAVSLAIKELCPVGTEQRAEKFFKWLVDSQISAQYILYSVADIERFINLHALGVIPNKRPSILLVLGRYSRDLSSEPSDLLEFLHALAGFSCEWSVCAFGAEESDCMALAAKHGGHARIGFENNMLMQDASLASTNACLISSFAARVNKLGLAIASTPQAKEVLRSTF
ncbi:3-keto-5-aminohexanoate cleavage protein [Alginatibacterium sediminis]|uniref:3-keto-5-aminohexanoate cleavage protein n=1 Tax=Alginatibacterium sediminis TaxID=2164068 RepID=A0A420ECU7_9ALTE|nr:3-keto-5-aminohexanoate cleavage protein [Alginatibacterium sediminis]RKF18527.1 3-keto-5-aminohexanoate cleavage protein [Alginatibacterium sediminis]